jgi:hypothetical protein
LTCSAGHNIHYISAINQKGKRKQLGWCTKKMIAGTMNLTTQKEEKMAHKKQAQRLGDPYCQGV